MATLNRFDKYVMRIFGGNDQRAARLLCYSGSSFVGRIDFYPDGAPMPQDFLRHSTRTEQFIFLTMSMSRFESVISTIRVEKPLHLYIDVNRGTVAQTRGLGHLATSAKEPVGEEEG